MLRGGPEAVDEGELDKALKELGKRGMVIVEERVKGTMGARSGTKDMLISLADYGEIQCVLSKDRMLTSYMHRRAVAR